MQIAAAATKVGTVKTVAGNVVTLVTDAKETVTITVRPENVGRSAAVHSVTARSLVPTDRGYFGGAPGTATLKLPMTWLRPAATRH